MSKKSNFLLIMLLTLTLMFGSIPTFANVVEFTDIEGHWAKDVIKKWQENEVINGYGDKFKPNAYITRGDLAVIIQRLMNYNTKAENNFEDLNSDKYYTDSILKLNAAGVMLGNNDKIRPTDQVTREEAIVMIARAFAISSNEKAEDEFADSEEISSWAKELIDAMKSAGYIQGRGDNKIYAKSSITRAEAVQIIDNIVALYANKPGEYEGNVNGIVLINSEDVVLKNVVADKIIVSESLGEEKVEFENVETEEIVIKEGKESTIKIKSDDTLKITAQDFGTIKNTQYQGISVGFSIGEYDIKEIKGMTVELYADDKLVAQNIANMEVWKTYELVNGQCSSPFIIKEGTFKETDDEAWSHGEFDAKQDEVVTKAKIIIKDKYGAQHIVETENDLTLNVAWEELFTTPELINVEAENFNTHKGLDYQGVNVGFNIGEGSNISNIQSMKVELYSDETLLATNEAIMEKMKEITTGVFSTPFIIKEGTYTKAAEEYWTLGEFNAKKGTIPTKTVITITDVFGREYKVENENLIVSGAAWSELLETPKVLGEITAENFNTNKDSNYIGINVGFNIGETDINHIGSIKVELYSGEELLATNKAIMNKMKEITNGIFSTPFIIKEGTYTKASEEYWEMSDIIVDEEKVPTKAVITIVDMFGEETIIVENNNLVMLDADYKTLITETPDFVELQAENFNTHYDSSYIGINVGFNIGKTNINLIKEMIVELYDGEEVLMTNTANMEKMKEITNGIFSTPFVLREGTYKMAEDEYWTFGESTKSMSNPENINITKAVIKVTDIYGKEYSVENTNLVEAAGSFSSLFEGKEILNIQAENFNTHKGEDYSGINVGFNIGNAENINAIRSMKVELYSDEELVATNKAIMEKMKEITNGIFSTPFIIKEGTYTKAGEEYWTLGEISLSKGRIATKTVITIVDIYGTEYKVENENLQKTNPTWDEIF